MSRHDQPPLALVLLAAVITVAVLTAPAALILWALFGV